MDKLKLYYPDVSTFSRYNGKFINKVFDINTEHPAFHSSFFYENRCVGRAVYGLDLDAINYEMGVTSGINTTVNRPFLLSLESWTPQQALPYLSSPPDLNPYYPGDSPYPEGKSVTRYDTPRAGQTYVFGLYDLTLRLSPINVISTGIVG